MENFPARAKGFSGAVDTVNIPQETEGDKTMAQNVLDRILAGESAADAEWNAAHEEEQELIAALTLISTACSSGWLRVKESSDDFLILAEKYLDELAEEWSAKGDKKYGA